jgi:serine/threonine-protein phosphatase 2A regulatory subunit B
MGDSADPEASDWTQTHHFETTDSENASEANELINSIAFSKCGDHIAVGDRGGRVWIYSTPSGRTFCRPAKHFERFDEPLKDVENNYEFYGQFQSHEPEFDYLKSLDIEEKINDIVWLPRTNNSLHLLATNDKTIKLWKIFEKPAGQPSFKCENSDFSSGDGLHVPKMMEMETITAAVLRRTFANCHAYHINSISLSSDYEMFLSADDLRLNLWHIDTDATKSCYQLIDLKPEDMNDLTEVITCAKYHPTHGSLLSYSSSKGYTYICDLRTNAKVGAPQKAFGVNIEESEKSFFTEILVSVADMDFSTDGTHLLTRDFLTVKIWDMRMENKPCKILPLHEHLDQRLCELYENDCIFDKFQLCSSPSGPYISTGSYGNMFKVVDWQNDSIETISLDNYNGTGVSTNYLDSINWEEAYQKKTLFTEWHSKENCFAVAVGASLYIYNQNTNPKDPL